MLVIFRLEIALKILAVIQTAVSSSRFILGRWLVFTIDFALLSNLNTITIIIRWKTHEHNLSIASLLAKLEIIKKGFHNNINIEFKIKVKIKVFVK